MTTNNGLFWYGVGGIGLSFCLAIAEEFVSFIPKLANTVVFWIGLGTVGLVILLVVIGSVIKFWKEVKG